MAIGLIPAAGRSRRMGRPKLLLPWGDTTVLGSVIETLRAGGVDPIVLVTASDDEELGRWARETLQQQPLIAHNPHAPRGMLSTIVCGLEALRHQHAAGLDREPLVITPGDLPALRVSTVRAVIAHAAAVDAALTLPSYGGRSGHPLVVAPRAAAEIPRLDPAVGLRQLKQRWETAIVEVDDAGIVNDVDTPADYRRLLGRSRG